MTLVAAALIFDPAGRLLICQRRQQPWALKWEFPGGKVEPGETAPQALERELEEELGIRAATGCEVACLRHQYQNGSSVELHFFALRDFGGAWENRIFHDARWVAPADLPAYDFLEADLELVRALAQGRLELPA